MIIEEKGLVKAIKAAYRHSGYTVLNQGGEVTIYTEGWFVRCLWTKLPRKALAWSHDGETVMLGAIRKTTWAWDWERTVWEALESVDLHKKEG